MAELPRSNENAVDKIDAIFSRQIEGLSKAEREKRLSALEKIAGAVRARRSRTA